MPELFAGIDLGGTTIGGVIADVRIERSQLGSRVGVLGAVALALRGS